MYYIVDRAVGGCDPAVVHLPLSPLQLCRFSEYKANTVQAVQATRQKPLFLPPSPKGDEETVEISASPSLRREQYSSASMAEWTTETTITSASSSICRSPPAAPAQHQKHQASPVFASKALPTRRQRGEKHQKHHRLTSSFTKLFWDVCATHIFETVYRC